MKLIRKKGADRIKIVGHNRAVFWLMIVLLILLLTIVFYLKVNGDFGDKNFECVVDNDCVPSSCSHSVSCVPINHAPNCSGVYSTQVCQPNTLDCGQGSCLCKKGKCGTSLD